MSPFNRQLRTYEHVWAVGEASVWRDPQQVITFRAASESHPWLKLHRQATTTVKPGRSAQKGYNLAALTRKCSILGRCTQTRLHMEGSLALVRRIAGAAESRGEGIYRLPRRPGPVLIYLYPYHQIIKQLSTSDDERRLQQQRFQRQAHPGSHVGRYNNRPAQLSLLPRAATHRPSCLALRKYCQDLTADQAQAALARPVQDHCAARTRRYKQWTRARKSDVCL